MSSFLDLMDRGAGDSYVADHILSPEFQKNKLSDEMTHEVGMSAAPNQYEQATTFGRRVMDDAVDVVMGGDTEQAFLNSFRGDYTDPSVEAIEPAFIGMDTVSSALVPKFAQMYIKQAAKLASSPEQFNRVVGNMLPGYNPEMRMTAYHGSPHKFDKFSLKHIGTGEGAQAYGHGLYFAERRDVGQEYVRTTAAYDTGPLNKAELKDFDYLVGGYGDIKTAKQASYRKISEIEAATDMDPADAKYQLDREYRDIERLNALDEKLDDPVGHLYEVDIPDEHVANFLDWDAPLSEQPESVRKALTELYQKQGRSMDTWESYTGGELYSALKVDDWYGAGKEVSELLNSLGIKGIKYFDGASRPGNIANQKALDVFNKFDGDIGKAVEFWAKLMHQRKPDDIKAYRKMFEDVSSKTRNLVVFDDSIIKTKTRNGEIIAPEDVEHWGGNQSQPEDDVSFWGGVQ